MALARLAEGNAGNTKQIVAAGGIDAVIFAMGTQRWGKLSARAFQDVAELHQHGCTALAHIAAHAESQVKIAAAGGIGAVLLAMRTHQDITALQQSACLALARFAHSNAENTQQIVAAGGIGAADA